MKALAVAWLLGAIAPEALAKQPPQPPCGSEPYPPFSEEETRPNFEVWTDSDLPAGWSPPACTGLAAGDFKLAIALAGSFQSGSPVEILAGRFGAISATRGIKYWSVTDKKWRVLVTDAAALTGPDGQRRSDLTSAEMRSGGDLYFAQHDNRSSSDVIYRMRVLTIASDRLAIAIENVSDVRLLGFSVFEPGSLKSVYFLQRRPPDRWGYYNLGLVGGGAMSGIYGHASSYVNRAVAFYRHFVGIPTDQEPPAAP